MATREAIKSALDNFEARMQEEGFKLSLAEYVKLFQLKQELGEDETTEIKVSWVETADKSSEE